MIRIIIGIIAVTFTVASADAARAKNAVKKEAKLAKKAGTPTQPSQIQTPQEQVAALRRAIEYLGKTYRQRYPKSAEYRNRLAVLEKSFVADQFAALRREALLANPEIDFDQILLVRRDEKYLALPQNWQGNSSLKKSVDNDIATLNIRQPNPAIQRVYKPQQPVFVGDLHLHFDAKRVLFSSTISDGSWQVFEMAVDGSKLRQVTPGTDADIDSYEGVYLADERIIFTSSTGFQGVPCVGGKVFVGNLHVMNPDGTEIRRLTFDQDNNWCPTLTHDGRVMYLRWEYTDSAHYFSRVLMRMNPDGTAQSELYGSESYWPNAVFYARPLPGSPTKFVGIVSGHHGVPRMGEMVIFDTARGRQENTGAVQRIPGYGKPVEDKIVDQLVVASWPKFLHPQPISQIAFIVSAKPTNNSKWGIYLVDIFDNMVLLKEEPSVALLEPIPLRKTFRPAAIPDRITPGEKTASVFLTDVHNGRGINGVPRGVVKSLRLYSYDYSYRKMGGHYQIGIEGPWDVRRVIGTVPVYEDGSAWFEIPANTPVAVQPLDAEGKSLQLMRSWFVGMPGERVSCVGCHEKQNEASPPRFAEAAKHAPAKPTSWYGPVRGFSFLREVQPVLDKFCVGCHDGKQTGRPNFADTTIIKTSTGMAKFPVSYTELHPYVRRGGPEGDYSGLTPLEFHADTSPLVKMLTKGHHNVKLDAEGWDRIITWIDQNVPCHGTWHEVKEIPGNFAQRRIECAKAYANLDENLEVIPPTPATRPAFVAPALESPRPQPVKMPGWPFSTRLGEETRLDLGNGITMALRKIPAGSYVMGDVNGALDEFPQQKVDIEEPFWMGTTEVSLEQYRQFDPKHRNGYYDRHYKDQVNPGYSMDNPKFPVIRVSWDDAMAFCRWLSAKTGKKVSLPTEQQWEWAARAGTDTPFFYGDLNTNFSKFANLADVQIKKLAVKGVNPQPIANPDKFWDFELKDARFDDGVLHLAETAHYQPNAWGLHDMIGNVAEWTLSDYSQRPGHKVIRGGSWADRPKDATASVRWGYPNWQRPFNLGFRVILESDAPTGAVAQTKGPQALDPNHQLNPDNQFPTVP